MIYSLGLHKPLTELVNACEMRKTTNATYPTVRKNTERISASPTTSNEKFR